MLRNAIGLVVFLYGGMPMARRIDAQAVPDTALAQSVDWGEPLATLLRRVAALAQEGFDDGQAEQVARDALHLSPYAISDSALRRSETFVRRVRFHDRFSDLTIRLTAADVGYVEVRFQASDVGLIAAIRDLIRHAHLASLLPLEDVRLDVREQLGTLLKPPTLVLAIETVRQYSCLGFGIDHVFEQRADTLDLKLLGVSPPMGLCPAALGPARMARKLDAPPGRYVLLVQYGASSGRLALDVTDSSTKLATQRASLVHADERLWWRFPPRSFALLCENIHVARPVCDDVGQWLLRQPGISPLTFPPPGLNPYVPDPAMNPDQQGAFFRYRAEETLVPVRRCFAEIERQIREAVGVFLTLRTWTGDQITAWSRKSYDQPHIAVPERVTTGPRCASGSGPH